MKKIKSLLALVLALSMVLALAACGTTPADPGDEMPSDGARTEPLVLSFGSCSGELRYISSHSRCASIRTAIAVSAASIILRYISL